jgi:3-oxoacyl-[acyl-carrier protein] reductase
MKIDLTGKVALVTGASGDLGRVISLQLAQCGADLAIHYHRNRAQAGSVESAVKKLGRRACVVQADVAEAGSILAMRDLVESRLGPPDIVVNNAVAQYAWKPVLEQAVEDYDSQFRSCVLQNVLMAQVFVPAMIRRKYGRVIAINTECAMQNHPTQSAYVSGKRGMDGVLRVLAREIGEHGITVNQVAPGWMISARDRDAGTEKSPDYEMKVPLRHRGEDLDVAHTVAFLASDFSKFITGAFIPVCGGNVMPTI